MKLWKLGRRAFAETLWVNNPPTQSQIQIAKRLGTDLQTDDTFLVASARISDAVADAIGDTPIHQPTEVQKRIAKELGIDISNDSRRVAWGKVKQTKQHRNYEVNMVALEDMRLAPGDVVIERHVLHTLTGKEMEFEFQGTVSAIRWDGLVYLRERDTRGAWAQFLSKVDDKS